MIARTLKALTAIPAAMCLSCATHTAETPAIQTEPGAVSAPPPASVQSHLVGHPGFEVADTATILFVNNHDRHIDAYTSDGPIRYEITDDTRIREGDQEIGLRQLRLGERVVVSAERKGEVYRAIDVQIIRDR